MNRENARSQMIAEVTLTWSPRNHFRAVTMPIRSRFISAYVIKSGAEIILILCLLIRYATNV